MNDDVIGKVADAAERAFDHSPSDDPWDDVARAAVAAHTEYLLALGGVTLRTIDQCLYRARKEGKDAGLALADLFARAVVQATDEWVSLWKQATNSVMALQDDLGAAEAKVARVVAYLDREERAAGGSVPFIYADEVRAALADEDGAA